MTLVQLSIPTTQRSCGGCTACCEILPVDDLHKPARCMCQHQREWGCAIYAARPDDCREYRATPFALMVADADVRDSHVPVHHQKVVFQSGNWLVFNSFGFQIATGNSFLMGNGERAKWPADPSLSAGNRINCRCVTTSVF